MSLQRFYRDSAPPPYNEALSSYSMIYRVFPWGSCLKAPRGINLTEPETFLCLKDSAVTFRPLFMGEMCVLEVERRPVDILV